MPIIKLDAIDSTNSFLKEWSSTEALQDYTVVVAKHQTKGRGQMGTVWDSQQSKNLMFSVFKEVRFVPFEQHFYLSIVTALALIRTLKNFNIPKLNIKWPNDILSAEKKVSGVLIENVIKHNALTSSVIGVGLNVNQTIFNNLPKASSMCLISGKPFDLDEILHVFLENLKHYFIVFEAGNLQGLKEEYESKLFRINKPSTFKDVKGELFSGFIKGVSQSGNLIVLLEDEVVKEFSLKELTLMY